MEKCCKVAALLRCMDGISKEIISGSECVASNDKGVSG